MKLTAHILRAIVILSIVCGYGIAGGVNATVLSPYESRFGYLGNPYGISGVEDMSQSWTAAFLSGLYFQPFDDVGFRWDRPHPGPFNRNLIEQTPGVYDFSIPDAYVRQAQRRGIQIIATIWPYVQWDQAQWADNPQCKKTSGWTADLPVSRCKPYDTQAYMAFVRALVGRYCCDGGNSMPGLLYPIKHWEILNEPESALTQSSPMIFFTGSPFDYLQLMDATAAAVRQADPSAAITNGGTVGNNLSYWREILLAAGARYFTLGSHHYFPSNSTSGDLGSADWINLLNEFGIRGSWLTEYRELSEDHPDIGITASETGQAIRIVKGYTRSFAAGTGRIFYVYYRMKDGGLIQPQGNRRRPAYYALKQLMAKVDGFTDVTPAAPNDNASVFAYKFMVNATPVYVLWAAAVTRVELPLSSAIVRGVTVTGALPLDDIGTMPVYSMLTSSGTVVIDITPIPVYVEEFQ